jgi:hypothetical protein
MEYDAIIEEWIMSNGIIWGLILEDKRGRFRDNTYIHTSTVISKKEDIKEGNIIETKNSKYLLGKEER